MLWLAAWATPFLHKPFVGEHRATGFFDHGDPTRDNDHRQLTQWGSWTWGRRGHGAYDWPMRVGTPVLAAADGVVRVARDLGPSRCGATIVEHDVRVVVRHEVDGIAYETVYAHLSELQVQPGASVLAGQTLALSGDTGCSSGPHLHFAVHELTPGRPTLLDPYGWAGEGEDPLQGRRGARWLWLPGEAPLLYRDVVVRRAPRGPVGITSVRPVAWKDTTEPDQEWLELGVRAEAEKLSLRGWSVRNRAGELHAIPRRAQVSPGQSYRLYSGSGRSTKRFGFLGRATDLWANEGDCAVLVDPEGRVAQRVELGPAGAGLCEEESGGMASRRGL